MSLKCTLQAPHFKASAESKAQEVLSMAHISE
jgi:hypothetical protein